jgi:hypothetical protein
MAEPFIFMLMFSGKAGANCDWLYRLSQSGRTKQTIGRGSRALAALQARVGDPEQLWRQR